MSDLPSQGLMQQMNARSVSGEHLEVLGKRAAAQWSEGRSSSLNEAVVSTVKTAGLSAEQVKRVVEFTNTAAYLTEFQKEGSKHRVVDFGSSGPASSSVVLQDLNDGGGGTVFDAGDGDYRMPPKTKTASAWEETAFEQMFGGGDAAYPEENPLGEAIDLRDKLASAYEQSTSILTGLETAFHDLRDRLFQHVKQASLSGHALSEVLEIWSGVAPTEEHVKVAFSSIMNELVDNEVFPSHEALAASLVKHAAVGVVSPSHPLVADFKEFCEVTTKLAETRADQQEYGEGAAQLTAFLSKQASNEGLIEQAGNAIDRASRYAGRGAEWAGTKLLGEGQGAKRLGTATRLGVKYVAPALAANEVYRRTLKHNPTFNQVKSTVVGAVPGTDAYQQKELELQMREQGYPMGGGQ